MKVKPSVRTSRSRAPVRAIGLVAAIVDFVRWRSSPGDTRQMLRDEIMRIVQAVWPEADAYIGNTHFCVRLLGPGTTDGESVFVDWEADE